jgi:hypothetical protein
MTDPILYLGRVTVFQKEITFAGFGQDAKKYSGRLNNAGALVLTYDGREGTQFKAEKIALPIAAASAKPAAHH